MQERESTSETRGARFLEAPPARTTTWKSMAMKLRQERVGDDGALWRRAGLIANKCPDSDSDSDSGSGSMCSGSGSGSVINFGLVYGPWSWAWLNFIKEKC